jgi:hypothetical protein
MKVGLLARVEARPEYADGVAAMLRGAQELPEQEQGTAAWFAFRENTTTFGVFDAFEDGQGRQAHLAARSPRRWGRPRRPSSARRRWSPVDLLGPRSPERRGTTAGLAAGRSPDWGASTCQTRPAATWSSNPPCGRIRSPSAGLLPASTGVDRAADQGTGQWLLRARR